ncbi:siderophore-interacting protein [Nocardioides sp. Root190]|uniref:RNA polymerase sigma factor SigJ n=1 Tax=Nocardioides sp. Root190 TaxID=1736488 RepID=UPI0006F4C1E3|nr:RNA polymerase sigma factor SigJ [Nocardioides sp. Root190]KRB72768.1 siderophore-interacting protein [Nocardioides sp. Root190]
MPEARDERLERLAQEYDELRPRMVRVAYAILGARSEAEDVVADCWTRLADADAREPVRDVTGWLTVAVARAATDVLRSARVRREQYVGPWLPEPYVDTTSPDPADRVTLDETVSYALLVLLESLSPAERAAFVLHDVFGMAFAEVATVVGRTPAAVRQLAARARAHLAERAPRFEVDRSAHDAVLGRFLAAAAGGDLAALLATLDPDVVLTSDGGGVVSSARRPVLGADRAARFLVGLVAKYVGGDVEIDLVEVNGASAIGIREAGALTSLVVLTVVGEQVARVDILRAPGKLAVANRPGPL